MTQENRQLTADCHFHFKCCKEGWLVGVMCYYNRLLVECTELVIGKSTEAKARNNKLKLAQWKMSSMFHVPDYKCDYCQQATINNILTDLPMPWLGRIQVCSSPVLWCLQPGLQNASETGEEQWFQHQCNVNIDLHLFQPSLHPDRQDQSVWCLESGAALPILVLCVINNRQKVSTERTKKLENFTSKCNGNILHSTRKLYLVYL